MSTAIARAGRLKPEVRLGQAISEFQTGLSTTQKAQFRSHQINASTTPLTIRDVMKLTAEINRCRPHERCFGPRLTNVLQAVQQFAALGDVVMGGTQNLLVCGVWSLIRMALLAVVSYSNYFERLSAILMGVGRSAPRYQSMGAIYPKSERLRSYMMEWCIILVRLCHHVLRLSQKSTLAQWVSTLNDAALDSFQGDLELWATSIKEEVHALMAQQLSEESGLNTWFRSHVSRQFDSLAHSKRLRARQRMLDACSTYDHVPAWKRIRKLGNTTVLAHLPQYAAWKMRRQSCTLRCTGKLGCGKSVLLANIVDDLNLEAIGPATIAYYFCQHDALDSLKARTIIGSLARQILYPVTDLEGADNFLLQGGLSVGIEEPISMLQHTVPKHHHTYFILDGIEHCDEHEVDLVLEALRDLQSKLSLAVCVSLRTGAPGMRPRGLEKLPLLSSFSMPEQHPDLEDYINTELQRRVESGRLAIGDPSLIIEIQNRLLQGAQGMFLWVVLQIKALCLERTDEALRRAIANLPSDLSQIYRTILAKSQIGGAGYSAQIFDLVLAACRPLTIDELRESLGVVPRHTVWDPQKMPNDIYATLACCGGLLAVDEESHGVRMIHHSVQTFLLNDIGGITRIDSANRMMAVTILTFLNYSIFSKQVSTTRAPQILAQSVTSSVIDTTISSLSQSQKLALKLLKKKIKGPEKDIGHALMELMSQPHSQLAGPLALFEYAISWWQEHVWSLNFYDEEMNKLLKGLLLVVDINRSDSHGRTALSHAAEQGLHDITEILLSQGAQDIPDASQKTPLMYAVGQCHSSTVNLILHSPVARPNVVDDSGETPLLSAVKGRNPIIVDTLLNNSQVLVNCQDAEGRAPLMLAALDNFREGVRLLLQRKTLPLGPSDHDGPIPVPASADHGDPTTMGDHIPGRTGLDVNIKDRFGRTPLWAAAANGNLQIVSLLSQSQGIQLDAADVNSTTPLWIAASKGHHRVVSYLLRWNGVAVNHRVVDGHTPLTIAALRNHDKVVSALISSGKTVHHFDKPAIDPLWLATKLGHDEYLEALMPHIRQADLTNYLVERALWMAADKGKVNVVRILLERGGIDPNYRYDGVATPLWAAARNGHADVVDFLAHYPIVEHQPIVELDAQGADGLTPLAIAASNGHAGAVSALIGLEWVEPNIEDSNGYTALWHAVRNRHYNVVSILVKSARVAVNHINSNDAHRSPLLLAISTEQADIVKALAARSLEGPPITDSGGRTPLKLARHFGLNPLAHYLYNCGLLE